MIDKNPDKIWLSKHEKMFLHLLMDDANLSDSEIAKELKITSQAVGKIRKKLENEKVIRGYKLDIDVKKLGINLIVVAKMELTPDGKKLEKGKITELITNCPEVIRALEVLGSDFSNMLNMGFKDMEGFESFMTSRENHNKLHKYIRIIQAYPLPMSNVLKKDERALVHKLIEEFGKQTQL